MPKYKLSNGKYIFVEDTDAQDFLNSEIGKGAELIQEGPVLNEIESPVGGFFGGEAKTNAVVGPVATATAKQKPATNMASSSVNGLSEPKISNEQALANYKKRTGKEANSIMDLSDEDYETPLDKFKPINYNKVVIDGRKKIKNYADERVKLTKKLEIFSYDQFGATNEAVDYVNQNLKSFDEKVDSEVKNLELNNEFKLRNDALNQLIKDTGNTQATGDSTKDLSSEFNVLNVFKGVSYYKDIEADEVISLNDEVEQDVLNKLDKRSLQKLAGGFYTLQEKEDLINEAKTGIITNRINTYKENLTKTTLNVESKVENNKKKLKELESFITPLKNRKDLTQKEIDTYNSNVEEYNSILDQSKNLIEEYGEYKDIETQKVVSLEGEVGFDIARGVLKNNFKLTDQVEKFREKYSGEGFWNGAADILGGEVVQGLYQTMKKATAGTITWVMANGSDLLTDQDSYSPYDAFSDVISNWSNKTLVPRSTSEDFSITKEEGGFKDFSARSYAKLGASMIPFTGYLLGEVRKGKYNNIKQAIGDTYLKFGNKGKVLKDASQTLKNNIIMTDATFRATILDNQKQAEAKGFNGLKANSYAATVSATEAMVQMIMPDTQFLKGVKGKAILDNFTGSLKGAANREAISSAVKEFSVNVLKEYGEEEINAFANIITDVSYGLALPKASDFLNQQIELTAGTLMLSGGMGSVGAAKTYSNQKKLVYNQIHNNISSLSTHLTEIAKKSNNDEVKGDIEKALKFAIDVSQAIESSPENVTSEQIDLLIEKKKLIEKKSKTDKSFHEAIDKSINEINEKIEAGSIRENVRRNFEKDVENLSKSLNSSGVKVDETIVFEDSDGRTAAEKMKEKLIELGKSEEFAEENKNSYGAFVTDKNGNELLVVNKEAAISDSVVSTGQHEFLHKLLKSRFESKPEELKKAANLLKEEIQSINEKTGQGSTFIARLKGYEVDLASGELSESGYYEEVFTLFSEALSSKDIEINKSVIGKIGDFIRQAFQNAGFKKIKFNNAEDVKNFVLDYNKAFSKGSIKGSLAGDTKSFAIGSSVSLSKSSDIETKIEELSDRYYDGEIDDIDYEQQLENLQKKLEVAQKEELAKPQEVKKPKKAEEDIKADQIGDAINKIIPKGTTKKQYDTETIGKVSEKLVSGRMLDPLIKKIAAGYGIVSDNVYGKSWEDFYDAVKGVQLLKNLQKFNPETNDDFGGFVIGSQFGIRNRVKEALTQFKKENEGGFKEDVETAKGIISEETEIEEGEVKEKTLIDPRKSRIVKDKLTEIEESIDIDPSTITTLTFKNVAEKFGGIAGAKIFDIPVKKVSDPTANLTYATKIVDGVPEYSEAGNIQNAFTNPQQAKEFIKLLPEFNIAGNEVEVSETGEIIDVSSSAKGYAIGVPNNLIKLMYDTYVDPRSSSDSKTERSRAITSPKGRSKGLTSQATVYRLKPEFTGTISNEAVTKFQDMLGITEKGKLNKYDREIGQVLKSAAKLYGSEVANIVVRDKINKLDIKTSKPKSQVLADIAAGKSTVMFSKENKQFKDQVQTLGADIIDRFSNVDNKTGKKTVNFEELHKHIQGFDKKIISEAEKRELGIYVSFTQENLKDILKSTEKITALRELLVKEQQALGYRFVYLDMLDKFSSLNESEDKIKLLKNFFADHTRSGRTGSIDNITTNKQVFEKVSELLGKNALVNLGFGFATRNKKGGKKGEKISWITHKGVGIQGALDVTLLKNKGFSDEDTLNRVLRDSNIAITTVTDFIDEQREKLKNKEITDQDYITIVKSYLRYLKIDQRGPIRKISTPGFEIKTDIEGKKIRTSDLYLEHEVSADEIVDMFLDYAKDNNPNKGKLIEKLKKAKVNIIPKYMADMLPKYKKGIPNQKGYESEPFASELKKYEDLIENYGDSSVEFEYTLRFSKNLSEEFNKIIENKTGIAYDKTISEVKAKMIADSKRNFNFFIPPSAEDFVGLLYYTLGKGETGEKQMQFYKRTLLDPYARANQAISRDRNSLGRRFKEIKKEFKVTPKDLKNRTPDGLFTREQAVRVFIWDSIGKEIPGLSEKDVKELVDYVKSDRNLSEFATQVMMLNPGKSYTTPTDTWITGNITTDLLEVLNTSRRAMHLKQWQQNVDAIFSNENLNKLEAAYGTQYREAMKNILKRMKTGRNRTYGTDTLTGRFTDWVNGSVGAIMFLNTRSAVLQTISAVNFINFTDNNVLAAGKALVNQKQYWTDFTTLFKSEYLVDRRDGLKVNVNEADIADIAKEKGVRGALNYLLKLGFTPTQIADSFAIASGGATFYRNRIKSLVKKGMDPVAAEKLAMRDFIETAEESQQSSRPDKISQQQAGPLGRIVLAFANTPAQYARLIKKAASDLKNGRGDAKTNISKILYYGAVQNIIFNALQQALFAMTFGDEEEESEKTVNIINGTIDGIARGTGLGGAVFTVVKNTALKLYRDSEKKNPKFEDGVLEMLKISPPISSKVQKLRAAGRTMSWDMDEIKEKGASFDNPAIMAGAKVTSAMFNFPADRAVQKVQNLVDASDSELETYKRLALVGGWSAWELGIKEEEKKKEAKNKSTKRRSSVKKSVLRKTIIR